MIVHWANDHSGSPRTESSLVVPQFVCQIKCREAENHHIGADVEDELQIWNIKLTCICQFCNVSRMD